MVRGGFQQAAVEWRCDPFHLHSFRQREQQRKRARAWMKHDGDHCAEAEGVWELWAEAGESTVCCSRFWQTFSAQWRSLGLFFFSNFFFDSGETHVSFHIWGRSFLLSFPLFSSLFLFFSVFFFSCLLFFFFFSLCVSLPLSLPSSIGSSDDSMILF